MDEEAACVLETTYSGRFLEGMRTTTEARLTVMFIAFIIGSLVIIFLGPLIWK